MTTVEFGSGLTVERLKASRYRLMLRWPMWTAGLMLMRFHAVLGMRTFACDAKWKVYFDPALEWDNGELDAALIHEFMHLCRDHAHRRENYIDDRAISESDVPPMQWNIAADLEINDDIREWGYTFADGYGVFPERFGLPEEMWAEWYFERLPQQQAAGNPSGGNGEDDSGDGAPMPGSSGSSSGDQGESSQSPSASGQGPATPPDGQGSGQGDSGPPTRPTGGDPANPAADGDQPCQVPGGQPDPQPSASEGAGSVEAAGPTDGGIGFGAGMGTGVDCGSAADGRPRPWEFAAPDDPSDKQVAEARREMWEQSSYSERQVVFGDEEPASPVARRLPVDKGWERAIHRYLEEFLRRDADEQTYGRINRRGGGAGDWYIKPGKGERIPSIVFLVDVSGSIGATAAQAAFTVVESFRGKRVAFDVVSFDTAAHACKPGRQIITGGGTYIPAGFAYVEKHHADAALVVVISDGETDWPHRPCRIPSVMFTWAYEAPKWCKTVRMSAAPNSQRNSKRVGKGRVYGRA